VKIAQRNWIGNSSGVEVTWQLCNKEGRSIDRQIVTFTTRKDTIPGVTFLVLAPESDYVSSVTSKEQAKEVKKYIEQMAGLSTAERQAQKEKTGVFTGSYAKNPFNGSIVPIYVADYVVGGYGTGAVMGMPGHDARDREFAAKFDLPTIFTTKVPDDIPESEVYAGSGKQINTGEGFDGLSNKEAGDKIFQLLQEKGLAKSSTQYHLRDWLISRQRYWGPPIPMIYCEFCAKHGQSWFTTPEAKKYQESGIRNQELREENDHNSSLLIHNSKQMAGWYPVPEKDLPVKLPYLEDYKPLGTGKAPLANSPEFYEVKCPVCDNMARRETDVSDTFLDSAWYFFRYLSVDRDDVVFDTETAKKWLPVNIYIGGAEHSVLHLLYARFMTMVLHDLGYITFEEPFSKFFAHGLIIKDGAKMSKSKGNVINPDDYIKKFGSDTLRCYLMFLGPFDQGGDFRDTGIEGMNRFLKRVWRLFADVSKNPPSLSPVKQAGSLHPPLSQRGASLMHLTIKGVTEDLENFRYNTAIAKLMTWYNFLAKQSQVSREEVRVYLQLLAPFAPFMTEELWNSLNYAEQNAEPRNSGNWSIHTSKWPTYEATFLTTDEVTIAVQINGKLRATLVMSKGQSQDKAFVEAAARRDEKANKFISAGKLKHIVYVPGKVLNFVVE
jgi:leucyl-tRNA synthetase